MKKILFLIVSFFIFHCLWADFTKQKGAFEFPISALSPDSPMSAAFLNHPITEADRITLSKDGHLQANGKRIKIYGTNLSEFPSKKDAAFTAQVLASQGFNCVRFHHIDADWSNCLIKKTDSGKHVFNKEAFDRFDYFFAQLKKAGIYSNINMLTGRYINDRDGYRSEVNSYTENKTVHALGFWDKEALEDQKKYASVILNHVNPYTGLAYKDDPAVAIVEINNENGLMMAYATGWLDEVRGYYWNELEDLWNIWLEKNGYNYEKLCSLYNVNKPVSKVFIDKDTNPHLEQHDGALVKLSKKDGENCLQILKNGSLSWHIQYSYNQIDVKHSDLLTLKFAIKAKSPCQISINISQAHDPWSFGGFYKKINLTNQYQEFEYPISGLMEDSNLRLCFSDMGFLKGNTVYIRDVYLCKGGSQVYVKEGYKSSSSKKTVYLPHYEEYQGFPNELKNLYMSFLYQTEEKYWGAMLDCIRKENSAKSLIMGTIVSCSSPYLQSMFDIIDSHAYWHHPAFPGHGWDTSNYYVNNQTMTKALDDNCLFNLAGQRIWGKPFSVTEYDHPYPSQFSAEGPLMLASFAAYQDWDCIFSFCSNIYKKSVKSLKISGFFDQSYNPAKSAPTPLAARIFRQSLVSPAPEKIYQKISKEDEAGKLYMVKNWEVYSSKRFGLNSLTSLFGQIGVCLDSYEVPEGRDNKDFSSITESIFNQSEDRGFVSQNKELFWDLDKGLYIICNDKVTITIAAPGVQLPVLQEEWKRPGRLQPFIPLEDFIACAAVKENGSYLISSCSWSGNKNEHLREYGNRKALYPNSMTRDDIKVTSNGTFGTGPALALSSDARLLLEGQESELLMLGMEGFEVKKINDFNLHKEDGSLWYLLRLGKKMSE
ncbi:MAG: hypothetical protein K6C97_11125 [Treponema sp.]|nr:hypothetical protein [Treponema sp.]